MTLAVAIAAGVGVEEPPPEQAATNIAATNKATEANTAERALRCFERIHPHGLLRRRETEQISASDQGASDASVIEQIR
jgi:hypothetical protein